MPTCSPCRDRAATTPRWPAEPHHRPGGSRLPPGPVGWPREKNGAVPLPGRSPSDAPGIAPGTSGRNAYGERCGPAARNGRGESVRHGVTSPTPATLVVSLRARRRFLSALSRTDRDARVSQEVDGVLTLGKARASSRTGRAWRSGGRGRPRHATAADPAHGHHRDVADDARRRLDEQLGAHRRPRGLGRGRRRPGHLRGQRQPAAVHAGHRARRSPRSPPTRSRRPAARCPRTASSGSSSTRRTPRGYPLPTGNTAFTCSSKCVKYVWDKGLDKFRYSSGSWSSASINACLNDAARESVGIVLQATAQLGHRLLRQRRHPAGAQRDAVRAAVQRELQARNGEPAHMSARAVLRRRTRTEAGYAAIIVALLSRRPS